MRFFRVYPREPCPDRTSRWRQTLIRVYQCNTHYYQCNRGSAGGGTGAAQATHSPAACAHVEDKEINAGHEQLHRLVVDAWLVDTHARLAREVDLGLGWGWW